MARQTFRSQRWTSVSDPASDINATSPLVSKYAAPEPAAKGLTRPYFSPTSQPLRVFYLGHTAFGHRSGGQQGTSHEDDEPAARRKECQRAIFAFISVVGAQSHALP